MKIKTTGYVLLLIAIVLASATPMAYIFGSTSNPIELAFLVSLVGTLGSFTLMVATGKQKHLTEHARNPRSLWSFVYVGATYAGLTLIFSYTTHYISASLLAVLYRSWPLMLILLAPLMLRERTTKYDLLAIAVGFAGLAAAFLGGASVGISASALPFALLVLFAAFIDAVASVVQRNYKYEIISTVFLYNLFSMLTVALFLPMAGSQFSFNLSAGDIFAVLFLGIVQNIMLTFMFTESIRMVKLSVVATATIIVPFFTVLLDFFVIHEPIETVYLLIALSVAVGLLIQRYAPKTSNYISGRSRERLPTLYDVTAAFVNTKSELIYNEIKGGGRVIACYKSLQEAASEPDYAHVVNRLARANPNCVILTNKADTPHVNQDEFEFIQEIVGHSDDDLLLLGVGKPNAVERAFEGLDRHFGQTSPGPPKVRS